MTLTEFLNWLFFGGGLWAMRQGGGVPVSKEGRRR